LKAYPFKKPLHSLFTSSPYLYLDNLTPFVIMQPRNSGFELYGDSKCE